jgi:catechol 2,3-dioxygenase-like lactoylglutathione lyase family enzyme
MLNFSHVTVGSNRLPEAKAFYDNLLAAFGIVGIFEHPSGGRIYGRDGTPILGVLGPFNGRPATFGNGTMVAFRCDTRDEVRSFYEKALKLGGTDEGPPGERVPNMFFGYVRDLDGNKLCVYSMG